VLICAQRQDPRPVKQYDRSNFVRTRARIRDLEIIFLHTPREDRSGRRVVWTMASTWKHNRILSACSHCRELCWGKTGWRRACRPIDFLLCDRWQSPYLSTVHCMLCGQEPAVPGLFVRRILPKEQALREIIQSTSFIRLLSRRIFSEWMNLIFLCRDLFSIFIIAFMPLHYVTLYYIIFITLHIICYIMFYYYITLHFTFYLTSCQSYLF